MGASSNSQSLAGKPLSHLMRHKFAGDIYLVNPRHDSISGIPCFHSIGDLPSAIDLALLVIPAHDVPDAIYACGERGIRNAVVLSSGFEEDTAGSFVTQRLREAISESGVRLVGPNSEGIWSIPERLTLTFGSAADRPQLLDGPVSVISHSGSIGGACMRQLQDRGIGCRYFVSSGNETDLSAMDFLEYMIIEGGSRVIAMFLEALTDGSRLRDLSEMARRTNVRLIALRAGESDLGRVATASHTGRMASAAEVYRGVFRQSGILEVATIADLISATEVAYLGSSFPRGWSQSEKGELGVGVIAISGGSRALIADSCGRHGVPLAEFTKQTVIRLDELLPQFGYAKNPTDTTGRVVDDPELFEAVARTIAADDQTGSLLFQYANGAEKQLDQHSNLLAAIATETGKIVIVSLLGKVSAEMEGRLLQRGFVCAQDPDEAVKRLDWLYILDRQWTEIPPRQIAATASPVPALDDWSSRAAFLSNLGIATPKWMIVETDDDLTQASVELTFPTVVKALPETAEHKTEQGLLRLDIHNQEELTSAVNQLRQILGPQTPLLVQEMVKGGLEILLAVRTDPDFGPILAIGAGGILTEWLRDITYVQLPASEVDIENALRTLKVWSLFGGFRGTKRRNLQSVLDAAMKLGDAFVARQDTSWELEINPLMIFEEPQTAMAVDVLVARN